MSERIVAFESGVDWYDASYEVLRLEVDTPLAELYLEYEKALESLPKYAAFDDWLVDVEYAEYLKMEVWDDFDMMRALERNDDE